MLMDDGSKVNLLSYRGFQVMKIPGECLTKDQAHMKGIGRVPVLVEGKIKLLLTLETPPTAQTHYV